MAGKNAIVLSGTGLLDDVVESLVVDGWDVVLPSRRYNPISGRTGGPGSARWTQAHWEHPRDLADAVRLALPGPAVLLVAWIHEHYRRNVLGAVRSFLAPGAPVVEVRGGIGVLVGPPDPTLPAHPTQMVLLGTVSERDPGRALSSAEISAGALDAMGRALRGAPPSLHQVGQRRPVRG